MSNTQLGNCQKDNQGNPIPTIGGSCNLASMHLDASVIDTPEPLMTEVNKSGLDWEFYNLEPNASAGAQPASQNDFYGNLYSLASFFSDEGHNPVLPPEVNSIQKTFTPSPSIIQPHLMDTTPPDCACNKNSNGFFKKNKDLLIFGVLGLLLYKNFK